MVVVLFIREFSRGQTQRHRPYLPLLGLERQPPLRLELGHLPLRLRPPAIALRRPPPLLLRGRDCHGLRQRPIVGRGRRLRGPAGGLARLELLVDVGLEAARVEARVLHPPGLRLPRGWGWNGGWGWGSHACMIRHQSITSQLAIIPGAPAPAPAPSVSRPPCRAPCVRGQLVDRASRRIS